MNLVKVTNYAEMSQQLLSIFTAQIREKPASVLSFTTGATPKGLLQLLAIAVNKGLDISKCTFFNLDEYVGKKSGIYSVHSFMHNYFYDVISQQPKNIFMLDAGAQAKDKELERYAGLLTQYPRDVQLLGLGVNGHIGANEPGTEFDSTLFVADCHESTIDATRSLFDLKYEETPRQMFTMGFQEIMAAGKLVLAAAGKSKAQAVKSIVEGGITRDVPASFLKTHRDFTFVIDEDAASLLA